MDLAQAAELFEGRYRIEATLGAGGMGTVVRARHLELDHPVAIKLMRRDVSDAWIARFLREGRAASRIDSDHVARVFDMSRLADGTPYMVMELLEGRDLGVVLEEDGPLSMPEAVRFARQACRALAAAHDLGIVHRDVKPENLFLTERVDRSPCVKLLDFGVSTEGGDRDPSTRLTGNQAVLGSPQFMSPEQLVSARDVDARADVWSLGATLFELVTGDHAFPANNIAELYTKILRDPPRRLGEALPTAPRELEAIIARCLEKSPDDRFPTMRALEAALAKVEGIDEHAAFEVRDTLPDDLARASSLGSSIPGAAASELDVADETPAPTVRPVVRETVVEPRPPRSSRWVIALGAVMVSSGLSFAVAAERSSPSVALRSSAHEANFATPTIASVLPASPPASETPPTERTSRFMDSVSLPDGVRRDLEQRLAAATQSVKEGEPEAAADGAQKVLDTLASRGIRPREAVSSIGAQATLLLGRVAGDELRAILSTPIDRRRDAEEALTKIERQMALVRAAYARVRPWNVQSFYRCALVETASLGLAIGEYFAEAAARAQGDDRLWLLKIAAERLRASRVEFRRALGMRTETMLCVEQARAGRRAAEDRLQNLPKATHPEAAPLNPKRRGF